VPQALRTQIRSATGLSGKLLVRFSESFDLSSQTGSRFQLEDALLLEISRWTDADARAILDQLLVYIRKQMLPEGAQRLILRENILLTIAGSASAESLFPCPSDFSSPARIIPRSAAKQLADLLGTGVQRVCLHGGAGCGKTTVLQQLEQQLPAGSHVVLFDAYGSGRYLDAARVRHRPVDAFVQLSNDMAVATSLPYFLLRSERVDADARFQLRTLGELVRRAQGVLKDEEKLYAACDFAALATSMALRIGDQEAFPWNWVAASLGRLSAGVALAAVARWEDAGMAGRGDTLEAVLPHLRIPGVNHAATLVAMNPLLQSDSLLEEAAKLTASRGNGSSSPEVEDLTHVARTWAVSRRARRRNDL
jgi:hypothetical protein